MTLAARCPQYHTCSAPKCPLDQGYHRRADRQAGEEKCRARKTTRLRIVEEARAEGGEAAVAVEGLPYGGLTGAENRGKGARARWDALTPDQQQAERARLEAISHGFPARKVAH